MGKKWTSLLLVWVLLLIAAERLLRYPEQTGDRRNILFANREYFHTIR